LGVSNKIGVTPFSRLTTEWFDRLVPVLRSADLLIAESYFFEKKIKFHLDYHTLMEHMPLLYPKKLFLTHMSRNMLNHLSEIREEAARDSLLISL